MIVATTTFELHSDPAKNDDLDSRLHVLCSESGLDESAAFQFRLAIEEALNNIIKHGYGGEPGHTIQVTWHSDQDGVEIELRDRARQPPPDFLEQATMPPPDALSGRGLLIIRAYTDAASYRRIGDENVLTMKRRR